MRWKKQNEPMLIASSRVRAIVIAVSCLFTLRVQHLSERRGSEIRPRRNWIDSLRLISAIEKHSHEKTRESARTRTPAAGPLCRPDWLMGVLQDGGILCRELSQVARRPRSPSRTEVSGRTAGLMVDGGRVKLSQQILSSCQQQTANLWTNGLLST